MSLLLGAHSRIESVGEMKAYERCIERKGHCNCGAPIFECSYWKGIHQRLGVGPNDSPLPLNTEDTSAFGTENANFLKALMDHAGGEYFCDSSKTKKRIFKYLASPQFEVTVLHLVRDGRAVAYSNFLKGRSYWNYLIRWRKRNVREVRRLFDAGLPADRYHRIRYEDLVIQPERTLKKLHEAIGLPLEERQLAEWAQGNHHIAGSYMAKKKHQAIQPDTRYLNGLSLLYWSLGSFFLGAVLRRLGYALRRSAMREILVK